jgi:predicted small integral membrane protein
VYTRAAKVLLTWAVAFYAIIIAAEAATALLCGVGGFRLLTAMRDPHRFHGAKGTAIAGLALGFVLWFAGFIAIGGEWVLMWRSAVWNGQEAAFRLAVILGIVLIYLIQPEGQADA